MLRNHKNPITSELTSFGIMVLALSTIALILIIALIVFLVMKFGVVKI